MKKYNEHKETGVEWLGKIPKNWKVIRLKRLCQVKRGASPRPIDDPKYFDDNGEYSWVRISDVTASHKYLFVTEQKLSKIGQELSVKLEPGRLFLSIAGSVGKPMITKIKCCIHDGFVYFENLNQNNEYFFYLFSGGELYKGLGKLGTQLNLNTDTVGMINVPVPPIAEQNIIAKYVANQSQKIDSLMEKRKKMIELLHEERAAIINNAVTRGINPKVKMKDSEVEWIGEIPEGWSEKKLKYLVEINNKSLPDDTDSKFEFYYMDISNAAEENEIFQLQQLNFENAPSRARRLPEKLDTIISTVRTYLKRISFVEDNYNEKLVVSTGFAVLHPLEQLDSKFLFYLVKSEPFIQKVVSESKGIAYPAINSNDLRDFILCYPSVLEQKEIVQFIETETSKIDRTLSQFEQEIVLLQEYKTALISEAVTGKIDVREEVQYA